MDTQEKRKNIKKAKLKTKAPSFTKNYAITGLDGRAVQKGDERYK
jgi:hypothetical protein